jgi:hypothetical protein
MPHKKAHKKTRKTKRGGYYGFSGAVGTGAPGWTQGSEMGDWAISSRGGNTQHGRGRKARKGGKKTRKVKRGGGSFGAVSASFEGTGTRGLIDVKGVDTKGAPAGSAAGGAFNNFGAQPGSGFGSFVTASK